MLLYNICHFGIHPIYKQRYVCVKPIMVSLCTSYTPTNNTDLIIDTFSVNSSCPHKRSPWVPFTWIPLSRITNDFPCICFFSSGVSGTHHPLSEVGTNNVFNTVSTCSSALQWYCQLLQNWWNPDWTWIVVWSCFCRSPSSNVWKRLLIYALHQQFSIWKRNSSM